MGERVEGVIFKSLTQWVFSPVIGCLVGVIGTYAFNVKQIREIQIAQGKDLAAVQVDVVELRRQTDLRLQSAVTIMTDVVKQNTELITLIKVQQSLK